MHWGATTRFVLALELQAGSVWHGGRKAREGKVVDVSDKGGPTFVYRAEASAGKHGDPFKWVAVSDVGRLGIGLPHRALHTEPPFADVNGLVMWLDAAGGDAKGLDGKPAADSEPLAAWKDRSRHRHHAVVVANATSPTFENGAVRMNGGNESMVSSAHVLGSGPGMTYVAALRLQRGSMHKVSGVVGTAAGRSGLFTGEDLVLSRSFPTWSVGGLPANTWSVLVSTTDYRIAQGHRLSFNGALTSVDHDVANLFDLPETRIGDTVSSIDQALDGWIGEVMLFDQPLTAADQRLVERDLASKWASAVIHDLRDESRAWARGWAAESDFMIAGRVGAMLIGEGGDDVLSSGAGNDDLSGGTGADHYLFGADAAGHNIIRDYDPTEGDVIDLSGALAEADGGLDQHVRTSASSRGTLVSVDIRGTRDGSENFVAGFSLDVPVVGLNPATLTTGLESSKAGLQSLSLSLASAQAVELGRADQLVLTGTYDDAPQQRRIISADVLYTSSQDGAAIDARGLLRGLTPGSTTVTALFAGLQAELEIDVMSSPVHPFAQVGEPRAFGTEPGAHQGLVFLGDQVFVSSNISVSSSGLIGHVYRMDRDFVIQQQAGLKPEPFGDLSHIGALGVYAGKLWATFMDLNEQHQLIAAGLVRIDPESLVLEEFVDLSAYTRFQDAICFDGDSVWFAPGAGLLMRAPMTSSGPEMVATVRYSIHGGVGVMQGLTCRGDTLYVVPETTTSHPDAMGIVVFGVRTLIPDPRVPEGLAAKKGLTPYNVPSYRYAVAYPSEETAYHESFSFHPDEPNTILPAFSRHREPELHRAAARSVARCSARAKTPR